MIEDAIENYYLIIETFDKHSLNEMFKNECGFELYNVSINEANKLRNSQLEQLPDNPSLEDKIDWLINYLNTNKAESILGFKITNVGTITYVLNGKQCSNKFTIHIGQCKPSSMEISSTDSQDSGIFHMKYGKNNHWLQSCDALRQIPTVFKNPVQVIQGKRKYNYIFYSNAGYTYVFGVPRRKYEETILITCY